MSELSVGTLSGLAANSYVIDVASGSQLTQPGMIVDVKSVLKTDTFTASVGASGNSAVTDLSITHSLKNASNKLIISAYFGTSANSNGFGQVGIAVANDGTLIGVGDAGSNRTRVGAGGITQAATGTSTSSPMSVQFVYAPGDTSSHTYTVRVINVRGTTETLYVNRTEDDTDDAGRARGSSGFIIQEVAV